MKALNCMHISDTHEENIFSIVSDSMTETKSKPIDILFISGDLTYRGKLDKLKQVYEQIEYLLMNFLVKEVVMIPGNHDLIFERRYGFESRKNAMAIFARDPRIHVRIHGPLVIQGVKIFASAWTPWFHSWAFNYHDEQGKTIWNDIPKDTQVLVTHGPPARILDLTEEGDHVGCDYLNQTIFALSKNKCLDYHLFGHIHEAYGRKRVGRIQFLNSSIMNRAYRPVNKPQYFKVEVYEPSEEVSLDKV